MFISRFKSNHAKNLHESSLCLIIFLVKALKFGGFATIGPWCLRGALLGDRVPLGSHKGTTRVPLEVHFWALGYH